MAVTAYSSAEQYNFEIVKKFAVMSLVWGLVGMFAGAPDLASSRKRLLKEKLRGKTGAAR